MANRTIELTQKKTALADAALQIVQLAETENRSMTPEETASVTAKTTEMQGIAASLDAERALSGFTAEATQYRAAQVHDNAADKPWASFGEQMMAVVEAARPGARIDPRLSTRAASGSNESVPSDGGFLVQTDYSDELLKRTNDTGVLVSKVRHLPIKADSNGIRINGIDEQSRANGSRWGGIQAFWANEADLLTASKPKFRQIDLRLQKLTGLCYATDELLQDSTAMSEVLMQAFPEEFGFKLDDAIVNGTGSGQPLGIMNSPALVTVAKESGQANTTIVANNIIKVWARLYARSRANAVWLINQDIEAQLPLMNVPVGTAGGSLIYMPAGGISGTPYGTLYGRPVIPIEQANTLGGLGDVLLADLSQYVMIDKGMQSAASIHVRFLYDEQVFRFIYRVDGQPIWNTPLTPFKGTSSQSPFVTLASRP